MQSAECIFSPSHVLSAAQLQTGFWQKKLQINFSSDNKMFQVYTSDEQRGTTGELSRSHTEKYLWEGCVLKYKIKLKPVTIVCENSMACQ